MLCLRFFIALSVQVPLGGMWQPGHSRDESIPAALLPWERVLHHGAHGKRGAPDALLCQQSLQCSIKQLLYSWLLAAGRPRNLRAGLFVC